MSITTRQKFWLHHHYTPLQLSNCGTFVPKSQSRLGLTGSTLLFISGTRKDHGIVREASNGRT